MGKYFGKEPRYSREEAEAQAKQAIDALVSRGRPPAEEWKGLAGRMGDINRELATRPPVDLPPPPPRRPEPDGGRVLGQRRDIGQILRPRPVAEPEPLVAEEPDDAPATPARPRRATTAKRAPRAATPVAAPAPAPKASKASKVTKKAVKRSTGATAAAPTKRATGATAAPPAKRATKKRSG